MSWDGRAVAKAFNSNILNDIANGDLSYIEKISMDILGYSSDVPLSVFFDDALRYLSNKYKNEYFYKNLIANQILLKNHSLDSAVMLSEFRVGLNKADCIIFNGKSTCYEIKTDYDSLARLEDQLASYLRLFDEVYVVCSNKFKKSVLELSPDCVGLLVLTEKNTFRTIRKATRRTLPLDKELMMQSLRQAEYVEIAEAICEKKMSCPNTQIFNNCLDVFKSCSDESLLNKLFIQTIKKHRKNNARLIESLPKSLTNAAISYKFDKKKIDTLSKYFNNEEMLNVLPNLTRKIE